MKPPFVLAAFLVAAVVVHAAESPGSDPLAEFKLWAKKNRFKLVASTTDLNKSSYPAKLSWTESRNGVEPRLVDAGLKLEMRDLVEDLGIQDTTVIQPGIEYHRDSTITKSGREKQNSFVGTLVADIQWNPGSGRLNPIIKPSIAYKNDRVDKGQGVTTAIGFSGFHSHTRLNSMDRTDRVPFSWSPLLEIQWESKNGIEPAVPSPTPTPLDGEVLRSKGGLAIRLYPLKAAFGRRVEIVGRYEGWYNFKRTGPFRDYSRFQRITIVSVNAWLNDDLNAGVGVDYSNGENPEKSKARDRSTELAFKLQF